jgi:hypothetical protein
LGLDVAFANDCSCSINRILAADIDGFGSSGYDDRLCEGRVFAKVSGLRYCTTCGCIGFTPSVFLSSDPR